MSYDLLSKIDHLVYAVPDLHEGIESITTLFGVKPMIGGQHQGLGTWNALLSLGSGIYFEILAPDPEQPDVVAKWLGLENLVEAKLTRWAAKTEQIEEIVARTNLGGLHLGNIFPGSRTKPDGTVLKWKLSNPMIDPGDGIIPFLIDWGNSPHPEVDLPKGCELVKLEVFHPVPENIESGLALLDVDLEVQNREVPGLVATIETPNGIVKLE